MARRSEHSREQIKEMVINAAEAIVIEESFFSLTIRKIALEIDYTVGSIYMVFENMDDLIMQVKTRTLIKLSLQLNEAISSKLSSEQQLTKLSLCYLEFANTEYNLWSMIFEHHLRPKTPIPDDYQQQVDAIFEKVACCFQRLDLERSNSECQLAARTLWSGIHGICILSISKHLDVVGIKSIEDSVLSLVNNYTHGWIEKKQS